MFKNNKQAIERIDVTEDVYVELYRIKQKNECDTINETIEGMIGILKEYQDVQKEKDKTNTMPEV